MPMPAIQSHHIFQVAYVVPDIERSIQEFARELNLGGWVILENIQYAKLHYKGTPSALKMITALAAAGDTTYELIQQMNDVPSVYADTVKSSGYGFHHFGILVDSLDAQIARYRARGYEVAMEVGANNGARACYIDTRDKLPGMLEMIERSEAVMGFLRLPYDAARECGSDGPAIQRY